MKGEGNREKSVTVRIMRLAHGEGLELPAYQSAAAAGLDLCAAVPVDSPTRIGPGERALIPTGLVVALPDGYEAQVRPRSGLALRSGVTVLNSPGTIDADYRGELQVLLINHGAEAFSVRRGERIAQLVVAQVVHANIAAAAFVEATARAQGGFGSTGTGPSAITPARYAAAKNKKPAAPKPKAKK